METHAFLYEGQTVIIPSVPPVLICFGPGENMIIDVSKGRQCVHNHLGRNRIRLDAQGWYVVWPCHPVEHAVVIGPFKHYEYLIAKWVSNGAKGVKPTLTRPTTPLVFLRNRNVRAAA